MERNKKITIISFAVASIFIAIVHYYNINALSWIDIPTHFIGGMLVAMFFPLSLAKKRPALTIFSIFAIGLGWELLEAVVSNIAVNDFIIRISKESIRDKAQDILFGFMGLVFVYQKQRSALNKKFAEKVSSIY